MDPFRKLQADYEALAAELQALQKTYAGKVDARQALEAQSKENQVVLSELVAAGDAEQVYKLVGPCLVAQDSAEARGNVKKRLDFIKAEMKRVEDALKTLEKKQQDKRKELVKIQTIIQQTTQAAEAAAAQG